MAGATWTRPVALTQPTSGDDAIFVAEKSGLVYRVSSGERTVFLDIRVRVDDRDERGLLGLAFHPDYEANGRFFAYYATRDPHLNVLAEYVRNPDGRTANVNEVRRLIRAEDPFDNHNGGMITFGPDAMLYVGMGDGGGPNDPFVNGQSLAVPFGKIHRLDVDAAPAFAPPDNPFAPPALQTLWAYGLRNPWRFSFDRATSELYIGDVGVSTAEEIDIRSFVEAAGSNFGWSGYEGTSVFDEARAASIADHVEPAYTYPHADEDGPLRGGCGVIGGYVYRGAAIPALNGWYLFGDYCSPDIAALRACGTAVREVTRAEGLSVLGLTSFGEDRSGELYLMGSTVVERIVSAEP